jgi:hypothetical protein
MTANDMASIRTAVQKANELLAEHQCPTDLREWGERHGVPEFAAMAWEVGFRAGVLAVMREGEDD